jgi:8-oxo-dGTP pyrophosphatase MutT (NUDIX family)
MIPPIFHLGASGHQDLGNEATRQFVEHSIRSLFLSSLQEHPNLVLYVALATGADQLFIQIALELAIPVEAVIPHEQYEAIFASDTERETYHRFLKQCRTIHHLGFSQQTDDAYLAAGQWIVEQSDLIVVVWNGFAPKGRGGTGDVASYAWQSGCPFIHIDLRNQSIRPYHNPIKRVQDAPLSASPLVQRTRRYQGTTLALDEYHIGFAPGKEAVREIVERPASVLIVPVNGPDLLTLIEEYDLGAQAWQLTLPGGKLQTAGPSALFEEAQRELREEAGYRARQFEPLLAINSHPGYVSHHVHLLIASGLEWDPLPGGVHEDIRVLTYRLEDALAETLVDYRCDPEAALALWIYAQKQRLVSFAPK